MKGDTHMPPRTESVLSFGDYIVILPGKSVFQVATEPSPWYDYANYFLLGNAQQGYADYSTELNGKSNNVSGFTLHVPNLQTSSDKLSGTVEIKESWLMPDSMNVGVKVTVNGVQLYRLGGTQTYLTYANSAVNTPSFLKLPVWSYGNTVVPSITVHNFNPAAPAAAVNPGQGIQVWGYTIYIKEVEQPRASRVLESGKYTPIAFTPFSPGS